MMCRFREQSGGVQKSVSDDREFKYCVLDNGLRITLISDPKADKVPYLVLTDSWFRRCIADLFREAPETPRTADTMLFV
jgi:hypothetical protein